MFHFPWRGPARLCASVHVLVFPWFCGLLGMDLDPHLTSGMAQGLKWQNNFRASLNPLLFPLLELPLSLGVGFSLLWASAITLSIYFEVVFFGP